MRGTVDDPHAPVIANQENAAEVIVIDRLRSGTQTTRPAALIIWAPGGTDSDMAGMARAALTDTGTARYDGLYLQRHRPLQVTGPVMCRRHYAQVPANQCAFPYVELPLISSEPGTGPSPELAVVLVLQRAHGGGVVKLDEDYLDRGVPTTGHLAGAFDEFTAGGLLAPADPDPHGPRWVTLTTAGQSRYDQFRCMPRLTGLPVPAPQFPVIKTPARERLNGPGPGQSDPHRPAESGVGPLRWVRCPDEGRLHLLGPAEVVVAAIGGHAEALCGRALPAAGLTLTHGSSGAVCMTCVNRIPSDPGPRGTP